MSQAEKLITKNDAYGTVGVPAAAAAPTARVHKWLTQKTRPQKPGPKNPARSEMDGFFCENISPKANSVRRRLLGTALVASKLTSTASLAHAPTRPDSGINRLGGNLTRSGSPQQHCSYKTADFAVNTQHTLPVYSLTAAL
jgi:hypothetical protein